MKMKSEHYAYLADRIERKMSECPRDTYPQLSDTRYMWDMLHMSGCTPWVCRDLYPYLNDSHIDTALNNILRVATR